MFKVMYHPQSKMEFVAKVEDEPTKNHHETNQSIKAAYMPAIPGDPLYPVRSFKMYMLHLHPENPYMWQQLNLHP